MEIHPFPPFIPDGAKVLIMGTFPPKPQRWAMDFYYPNRINDFWRIMGLVFFEDKDHFLTTDGNFKLEDIKQFLTERHIAMHDTAHVVNRLKDNASDKFLEIVEPTDLEALLKLMPECELIATTGEKAAQVLAQMTATPMLNMGETTATRWNGRELQITRLPSTSRAYPMKLETKAGYYARALKKIINV